MSLLTQASLIVTPNAVKASKLYSIIPSNGNGDMDVVRATTATRVNSLGLIESVAANVPRLNYDSVGGCPSILVEPQRTNRLLNSDVVVTQSITTAGLQMAVSFYGTGTITFSGTFVGSLVGTGANNRVSIVFTPTTGTLVLTVTGSVTKGQVETGGYATSYIPTTTASVTRNADIISKTGISGLMNPSQGTFYVEAAALNNVDTIARWVALGNAEIGTNTVLIQFPSTGSQIRFDVNGGGSINRVVLSGMTITNFNKIAISWSSSGSFAYVNGVKYTMLIVSGTVNAVPTALSRIDFDAYYTGQESRSKIKSAIIFKNQLTDQECIALTTL